MPTYEYACTACGHRLEAVQTFSDDPLTECPECGGQLRKVYGSVGIVLKGSGFYKTDSRAAASAANGSGSRRRREVHRRVAGHRLDAEEGDPGGRERQDSGAAAKPPPADRRAADGSVAAERHVRDGQGLPRGHAREPAHIATDLDHRLQHALQRRGHGDLPHGLGQRAASIISPSAPTEKSPLTGFTPECTPVTDCT